MDVPTVSIALPEPLFERLARCAERANRSVEAELANVVAVLPDEDGEGRADALPSDLAEAITALNLLDDSDLWRAARQLFASDRAAELESLHLKRQSEGLSAAEESDRAALMQEYTRIMLIRSRAAALLKQRGHDVSDLLAADEQ